MAVDVQTSQQGGNAEAAGMQARVQDGPVIQTRFQSGTAAPAADSLASGHSRGRTSQGGAESP